MVVLIVDDNLLSGTRLLSQAQAAGWLASRIGPGLEALIRVREHRPDAIIVNLAATTHDAARFIQALKAEPDLESIPVLGFCGHRERPRRKAALGAGCDRVVSNESVAAHLPTLLEDLMRPPPATGLTDVRDLR